MTVIYEDFVWKMCSDASKGSQRDLLLTAALGLTGESGEFADEVKKFFFHPWVDEDLGDLARYDAFRERAIKELGDNLWYMALAARALGTTLKDIEQANITKLTNRYPDRV